MGYLANMSSDPRDELCLDFALHASAHRICALFTLLVFFWYCDCRLQLLSSLYASDLLLKQDRFC